MKTNAHNYFQKHPFLLSTTLAGKKSLFLTQDYEKWQRDRLTAEIAFDQELYFSDYGETITAKCTKRLESWQKRSSINLRGEMDACVLEIVLETILFKLGLVESDLLEKIIVDSSRLALLKLETFYLFKPLWYFSPYFWQYRKLFGSYRQMIRELLCERLCHEPRWDSTVDNFMRAYSSLDRAPLLDKISDHIAFFLIVGYFTSSSALQWLFVLLAQYPDVEGKIREELQRVVGSRLPTYADLGELRYLRATIKESLRFRPVSHRLMRQAEEEDEIGGYLIPAKAGISLSVAYIHHHPDFWERPEQFDPTRFLENPLGQQNPYAYIPFGGGERKCIASAFALMEIMLVCATTLQRFRLTLPPDTQVAIDPTLITNRPLIPPMQLISLNP